MTKEECDGGEEFNMVKKYLNIGDKITLESESGCYLSPKTNKPQVFIVSSISDKGIEIKSENTTND